MTMQHIIVAFFEKTSGILLVFIWLKNAPDTVTKIELM